jgi:hypothetical protein
MNALRTPSCWIQKKCRKCFVRVNSKKNSLRSSFPWYVSPLSREQAAKLRNGEDLNVAPACWQAGGGLQRGTSSLANTVRRHRKPLTLSE